jgi:hypothetical protein
MFLLEPFPYLAGNKSQLLEQIVAYNTMVAIKYDYETNDSLKGKRIVEGCYNANSRPSWI